MEHKDIWLVLGLTVILAVAVSISTASITGDVIFGKAIVAKKINTNVITPPQIPTDACKLVQIYNTGDPYYGSTVSANKICGDATLTGSSEYRCAAINYKKSTYIYNGPVSNNRCTGTFTAVDDDTLLSDYLACDSFSSDPTRVSSMWGQVPGGTSTVYSLVDSNHCAEWRMQKVGVLCCK